MAAADTLTYDPTAVTVGAWARTGGTTPQGVLSDTVDTTYMSVGSSNAPMYVDVQDAAGDLGIITNVAVYVRAAETGAGTTALRLGLGQGGAIITGGWGASTQTVSGTTFVEFTDSWAVDPRGGSWTWADVTALQAVVQEEDGTPNTLQIAKMGVGDVRDIEIVGDAERAAERWDFRVGHNLASAVGSTLWRGPLHRFQHFFFHTPLVHLFIEASSVYHDRLWWPLKGRRIQDRLKTESQWGRLFDAY